MEYYKDKISVIMGIYNCEDTLTESINSIINQSYKNWELILCDDCSSDRTYEIANKFAKQYDQIKVIQNNENKGLAYSLNKCLEHANGEYIARHDGDDICLSSRFEEEIKFIKNENVDLVGTGVSFFDETGEWGEVHFCSYPNKYDVYKRSVFTHPTILIKRHVLEHIGGYTVSNITTRTEDYDLFVKLYANGYRGANMKEVLVKVRRDNQAYKRKEFKYRIDETICRYYAWKSLKLNIILLPSILMPIIKGLIPVRLLKIYHKFKFKR